MRFLYSPSSSSSTSEFPTTSCFSATLRRLLCFHSLPALPFDHHIQEAYGDSDDLCCANNLEGNPGIVAKLMGLDSMPVGNSIHEWRELRLQKKGALVPEAPSFVELENDKFIILSFEGGGKDKELKLKSSKMRKGSEFQERTRNRKNQEMPIRQSPKNSNEVMNSCDLLDFNKNSKKSCETECARSRTNNLGKVEIESDSENSSPVSVLEFPDHQEASHSGKEELKFKILNSRRKLKGDLDQKASSPSPSPRSSCNSTDEGVELSKKDKGCVGLKKKNPMNEKMWKEICKMVERDVMDSSIMKRERWKGEDYKEIGVNLELQILDQLILELLFTIT